MWENMKAHWEDWGYPLRPNPQEVEVYKNQRIVLGDTLLLGNTEELKPLATFTADKYLNVDWYDIQLERNYERYANVIGDGVLVVTDERLISHVLTNLLRPGGRFITRVFLRNTHPQLSDNIQIRKFQNFKENYIPVKEIHALWGDTPTTRDYRDSDDVYYFPDLWQLPPYSEIYYQNYKYGQFFPVIVWTA